MKSGDLALTPQIAFNGTKATITAWADAVVGMEAYATDTSEKGVFDGAVWQWSPIAGGGTWGSITGTLSAQTDLQTALNGKVDENAGITAGTKTKITYDAKGLVTGGADATTADIPDSTNKRYVTDADLTDIGNLSGTNSGDSATNSTSNAYADSKVEDALVNGVTTKAPSQNIVFDELALKQNLDSDLTAIAALSPADDDIIQRKAGAWVSRTVAQYITDLTAGLSALFIKVDGWITGSGTWTYSSADSPTFVISTSTDLTGLIGVGYKIKLTQTTAKYFIVTAITSSTITIYGGTDYTLANAAISSPYYSPAKSPLGFPMSPEKWTIKVTDTTNRTQPNPVYDTWYNLGSVSITIPIGVWRVKWEQALYSDRAAAGNVAGFTTLSTSNNTESDVSSTRAFYATAVTGYQISLVMVGNLYTLTSKATYYINSKTNQANGTTLISVNDTGQTLLIEAVCAYL